MPSWFGGGVNLVPFTDASSMPAFLEESLKRIQKAAPKKRPEILAAVKQATAMLPHLPKAEEALTNEDWLSGGAAVMLEPFVLCCGKDVKVPKLCLLGLDGIGKLLSCGYAGTQDEDGGWSMADRAIQAAGDCFYYPEDQVKMAIVETVRAAVCCEGSVVHETALLSAVKTVYNIYLSSKLEEQREMAKNALADVLSEVFTRMESDGADGEGAEGDAAAEGDGTEAEPAAAEGGETAEEPKEEEKPVSPTAVVKASQGGSGEIDDDEDAAVSDLNVVQTDCYLLFRALCKISMKVVDKGLPDDSEPVRSKIKALELIMHVLNSSGAVFQTGEKFIYAVKEYLSLSLLKNCVSGVPSVFHTSVDIFSFLVQHFVDHLKTELGVFFNNIFFRFLESSNSTFDQKSTVLKVLQTLCSTSSFSVDLYLNYDCDLESLNIYERMINNLSRLAQGSHRMDALMTHEQTSELQKHALEALLAVCDGMVKWCEVCMERDAAEKAEANKDKDSEGGEDDEEKEAEEAIERLEQGKSRWEMDDLADGDTTAVGKAFATKNRKDLTVQGVNKFNLKPKKGIKFLVEHKIITMEPDSVAEFLRFTPGVDMTQLGDFIGEGSDWHKQVMYKFIETMDYAGKTFDLALRELLSAFRLPGEAQKIDRIVEKFAERYCMFMPEAFENTDAAYVLGYSVIMLNTDLHNPGVPKKMTKEEFIRNNRGINGDGGDLPEDFMMGIYENIRDNEIKMKSDAESADTSLLNPKKRQQIWQSESEAIIQRSHDIFKGKVKSAEWYHAKEKEHVSLMFNVAWCPLLAAFSVVMEDCDDSSIINLCLRGFTECTHIGSLFYMDVERDAFVSSLAKFTLLHSTREMKQKNIDTIKTILQIALEEGNCLDASWLQIQRSISQLERMHTMGKGGREDSSFFGTAGPSSPPAAAPPVAASPKSSKKSKGIPDAEMQKNQAKAFEDFNAASVGQQVDRSAIDRIYANSSNLNSEAILHFVTHLCAVSMEELSMPEPRIFSLQKVVEIAYYNMNRIRIVWSKIWKILAEHFTRVGCHHNDQIAMFGVDSLRQLAFKFLEKEEYSGYNFQQEFLKPYEHIMANSKSIMIRELVAACVNQLTQARSENIKSGWKTVLGVLSVAANDPENSIVTMSFGNLEELIKNHTKDLLSIFEDLVNCVVAFAENKVNTTIAMKSIAHLLNCATRLKAGEIIEIPSESTADYGTYTFTTDDTMKLWFPVLTGLGRVAKDERAQVRDAALETLLGLLDESGPSFSKELLSQIFKAVLVPIFDDACADGETDAQSEEWLQTTCFDALSGVIKQFNKCYTSRDLGDVLDDILALLSRCIAQRRESLARIGIECATLLCTGGIAHFDGAAWTRMFDQYGTLFQLTMPRELYDSVNAPSTPVAASLDDADSAVAKEAAAAAAAAAEAEAFIDGVSANLKAASQELAKAGDAKAEAEKATKQCKELLYGASNTLNLARAEMPEMAAYSAIGGLENTSEQLAADERAADGDANGEAAGESSADAEDVKVEVEGEAAAEGEAASAAAEDATAAEPAAAAASPELMAAVTEAEAGVAAAEKAVSNAEATLAEAATRVETAEHEFQYRSADLEKAEASAAEAIKAKAVAEDKARREAEIRAKQEAESERSRLLRFRGVRSKCVAQLLLVESIETVFLASMEVIEDSHVELLLESLHSSHAFAKGFNADLQLRTKLFELGFMKKVPNLLKQAVNGISAYTRILFKLYGSEKEASRAFAEPKLLLIIDELVFFFLSLSSEMTLESAKEQEAYAPTIVAVLQQLHAMSPELFKKHIPALYNSIVLLARSESAEVRFALGDLLADCIGPLVAESTGPLKPRPELPEPENEPEPDPEPEPEPAAEAENPAAVTDDVEDEPVPAKLGLL